MFQIHLGYCFAVTYLLINYVGILLRSYTDASCIIATTYYQANCLCRLILCLHLRSSNLFICYIRTISSCVVSRNLLLVNTLCFKLMMKEILYLRILQYICGNLFFEVIAYYPGNPERSYILLTNFSQEFYPHCHLCYLV